ncbi:uncharacterized protein KZ484_019851 [Pholidichthys leucotaenia]
MAEETTICELAQLEKQLQCLLSQYSSDELRARSESFCSEFNKLVEEYASLWQVPLPQLRILEIALCYFAKVSASFSTNCDHVLYTLSRLVLSIFELLLFFDQKDFNQEPLNHFTDTFQECFLVLTKHQNVHMLQLERLVQGGGPWASPALQAILSETILPQNEVNEYISSELPVFFELRVRYLLSCERLTEAMALAKCCAQHPTTGQHSFFLQIYIMWLYKTSHYDCLLKEVADIDWKYAVHIICNLECEEKDEFLLALCTAFLSQQLRRGDMYYLYELVFLWTKLHTRLNTCKQALLDESRQLMLCATNINSIFPFIRAVLQEVDEDGIQFCVELCASALNSCLPGDVFTKSLIYKTIAALLPNDLEICRACALLVFFMERTIESYKMVYLLYMHPDQEYHVEYSLIGNHVRFETLQVLKKDLYFDPEFWSLIALRTNCLKLMSEKVVSSALEEIMEDKWISEYCTKDLFRSNMAVCHKGRKSTLQTATKRQRHSEGVETASKRLKVGPGRPRLNANHTVKKATQRHRPLKETSSEPLRRSFWQLDRVQENVNRGYGLCRRATRFSEKNLPKRRIRQPRWLLEDSGFLEENVPVKIKNHRLKHEKHYRSAVIKRSETGQIKNSSKHKASEESRPLARENNKQEKGFSLDFLQPEPPPQVILELSLPDNELMGTFTEETCNRHRGLPQVLFYKPTVKLPDSAQPIKTVHGKEVILRARDLTMFVQQLHCYIRRPKGKGNGLHVQGSVSTITRSSMQGSPQKDPPKESLNMSANEMKVGITSGRSAVQKDTDSSVLEKAQLSELVSGKISSPRKVSESLVELEASHTPTVPKVSKSPVLQVSQAQRTEKDSVLLEKYVADMEPTIMTETSSATAATIDSNLNMVSPTLTVEPYEESAVEMKVTIASQATVLDKVSQVPSLEDMPIIEVSQPSKADKNQKKITDEIQRGSNEINLLNSKADASVVPRCQDVTLKDEGQELNSNSSQSESVSKSVISSISDATPRKKSASPNKASQTEAFHTLTAQENIRDISAPTSETEMVTELAPERPAHDLENDKLQTPNKSASKQSRDDNKPKAPCRSPTTSSCSKTDQKASVVELQGKKRTDSTQPMDSGTQENSEFEEMQPESEESKLEYCCVFCNKDFKGTLVVAHAMFHYRKDECMFCGTTFSDDLQAMMHLSDHIEMLKRSKEAAGHKTRESRVPYTKENPTPKTSAKAKIANTSSGCQRRGRPRKSAVCPTSVTPLSESRALRSHEKLGDGLSLQEKQNMSEHLNSKVPVHKLNGQIDKDLSSPDRNLKAKQIIIQPETSRKRTSKGAVNSTVQDNQSRQTDSSRTTVKINKEFVCSAEDKVETLHDKKIATKQNEKVVKEKNVEPQEKVSCPVNGCSWFTDLSKNRVALLYHALDDHYGDIKPLELAFHVGNSKCSICMRVLWSFEHFQHHVERHRLTPRYPCLHQGCTARFKNGMEMRRHARKHSPLQAVCCLPGCSQLFICLWALNLHEREHYLTKSTQPDKNKSLQTRDKHNDMPLKQQHQSLNVTNAPTAVNKTADVKTTQKFREQATHTSSARKVAKDPPLLPRVSLTKQGLQERTDKKNSYVLTNLSNKNRSMQVAGPNLRSKPSLRKGHIPITIPSSAKIHKVMSSSSLKHGSKLQHRIMKKHVTINTNGPKRRGRPPKFNKAMCGENTTTAQTIRKKSSGQIPSPDVTVVARKKVNEDKIPKDVVKTTAVPVDESKTKMQSRPVLKNQVKAKEILHNTRQSSSLKKSITPISELGRKKSNAVEIRRLKIKNHAEASDLNKAKKHKIINNKGSKKTVKKHGFNLEPSVLSASQKTAKSKSVVPQVEAKATSEVVKSAANGEVNAKLESLDSTQKGSDNSALPVPANSSTVPQSTHIPKKKKEEEKKPSTKKIENTLTALAVSSKAKTHTTVTEKAHKKTEMTNCCESSSKKTAISKQIEAIAAFIKSANNKAKAVVENKNSVPSIPPQNLNTPPTIEKIQKVKRWSKLIVKEGSNTGTTASKPSKNHTEDGKKRNKKFIQGKLSYKSNSKPCKVKKVSSSKCDKQKDKASGSAASVKGRLDVEGKGKDEASDPVVSSSVFAVPAAISILNEQTCPSTAPDMGTKKAAKLEKPKKNSNPNKESKKSKAVPRDDPKTVKGTKMEKTEKNSDPNKDSKKRKAVSKDDPKTVKETKMEISEKNSDPNKEGKKRKAVSKDDPKTVKETKMEKSEKNSDPNKERKKRKAVSRNDLKTVKETKMQKSQKNSDPNKERKKRKAVSKDDLKTIKETKMEMSEKISDPNKESKKRKAVSKDDPKTVKETKMEMSEKNSDPNKESKKHKAVSKDDPKTVKETKMEKPKKNSDPNKESKKRKAVPKDDPKTVKETKMEKAKKNSDPNKESKKCKAVPKDDPKTVKETKMEMSEKNSDPNKESKKHKAVSKDDPKTVKETKMEKPKKNSDPNKESKKRKAVPKDDPKTVKETKMEKAKKNLDSNKESKKRKAVSKDDSKMLKKRCKNQSNSSTLNEKLPESEMKVQPLVEVNAGVEVISVDEKEKPSTESQCPHSVPGYCVLKEEALSDVKNAVCVDTLVEYSKKPYMRPPPTAYLDEKYTAMPKRRKEVVFFQESQMSSSPQLASVMATLQRQRCANCFATFNGVDELQSHLQLKKCSEFFGFDSDEEGTS